MKLGPGCKFTNGRWFVYVPKMCQETLMKMCFKIILDCKIASRPEDFILNKSQWSKSKTECWGSLKSLCRYPSQIRRYSILTPTHWKIVSRIYWGLSFSVTVFLPGLESHLLNTVAWVTDRCTGRSLKSLGVVTMSLSSIRCDVFFILEQVCYKPIQQILLEDRLSLDTTSIYF